MPTYVIYVVSFLAAFLATYAMGRGLPRAMARHPDLLVDFNKDRRKTPWIFRVWRVLLQITARELPDGLVARLRSQIERDLIRVAAPRERTPEIFLGEAVLGGLAVTLLFGLLLLATLGQMFSFLALGFGLIYTFGIRPQQLRSDAQQRVAKISRQLPYAIDLAALVLSAGGTLREALEVICGHSRDEPLAQEVAIALAEMRSGVTQARALRNMAERLELSDLTSLVIAINRGEEAGAPMGTTLRTQAEIFRFWRLQKAERLAVEAPVKMMFPNLLIMLAVVLIVLGPVIIKLAGGSWF